MNPDHKDEESEAVVSKDKGPDVKDKEKTGVEDEEKIGMDDKGKAEVKITANAKNKNKDAAGLNSCQKNEETTTAAGQDEVLSSKSGEKKAAVNPIDDSKDADTEKGSLTEGEGAAGVKMMNDSKSLNNSITGCPRGNDNA